MTEAVTEAVTGPARERHRTSPTVPVEADGSPIPARLRIVGWITLATGLGLLAVVLTIRSALLTDTERDSNANIAQEIEEFRTFAASGVDPETGQSFASAARLLELYLQRQFPGRGEVLVGWDRSAPDPTSAAIVQRVDDDYGLTSDLEEVAELVDSSATTGLDDLDDESYRWARADVLDATGAVTGSFLIAEFDGPARAEVSDIVRLVLLVCVGGLLLTAGIAFAIAGVILAPVRKVRHAASQISRTDIGRRLEVRGRDDIAALSTTFNAMLDRLETSFRAQHRFVRTAEAHVRGPLQVLADAASTTQQRRAASDEVATTLGDMALLTASQLPGFVVRRDTAVDDLQAQALAAARRVAPGRAWEPDFTATGLAQVDGERVVGALAALAHNADEQHRGDRPLRIGSSSDTEHVELWVEDDGPGLDADQARGVLDRYSDLVDEQGPAVDAGLGLAVVHAVADAHYGQAWVETTPGAGARFGLRLPRRAPDGGVSDDGADDGGEVGA